MIHKIDRYDVFIAVLILILATAIGAGILSEIRKGSGCYTYERPLEPVTHKDQREDYCYNPETDYYLYCERIPVECE